MGSEWCEGENLDWRTQEAEMRGERHEGNRRRMEEEWVIALTYFNITINVIYH